MALISHGALGVVSGCAEGSVVASRFILPPPEEVGVDAAIASVVSEPESLVVLLKASLCEENAFALLLSKTCIHWMVDPITFQVFAQINSFQTICRSSYHCMANSTAGLCSGECSFHNVLS